MPIFIRESEVPLWLKPAVARPRRVKPVQREFAEQCAVIEWAGYNTGKYPELELLFAVPNGEHRHKAVAAKLRLAGVKRGVPDLILPVARGGFHGLYIEMKAEDGGVSKDQRKWIERLREQGYKVEVCWSADEAIEELTSYLSL